MSIWELSGGEISGTKDIDELGARGAILTMGSLVEDKLRFSQVFEDASAAQEIGDLQEITLWRNGVRYFKGWVTETRARDTSSNGLQIDTTISGVWWWLLQTPLSGEAKGSDGGDLKERIAFAFDTGDLRSHIIAAIDRSKTLGVSIDVGGISSCFDIPQITLKQMSIADAIVELMRFIPDAVAWIDYAPDVPTFNIKRRAVAAVETLTVGQPPCTSIDVNPRLELETTQVSISFVDRAADGASIFKEQIHGTATNGKRQILTVSGPELDTFLPNDLFDTYAAETVAGSAVETAALSAIAGFDAAKTAGLTNELAFDSYSANFYATAALAGTQTSPQSFTLPAVTYKTPSGQTVSPTGKHIFIGDTPPEWMKTEHGAQEVIIAGKWWYLHSTQNGDIGHDIAEPAWHDDLPGVTALRSGYMNSGIYGWTYNHLYGADFEFTAWLVDTDYSTETTLYKTSDYTFVQPPAGFAQALLETQNFIPYEGVLKVAAQEAGGFDARGRCINIAGSLPKHATMKAMVQSVSLDLQTGSTSIELGVAKRLSFLGLVNRFRRTASDNIIWLSGTGTATGGTIGTSSTSGGSTSTDDGTGDTLGTGLTFWNSGAEGGGFGDGDYGGEDLKKNGAGSAGGVLAVSSGYSALYIDAGNMQETSYFYRRYVFFSFGIGNISIPAFTAPSGYDGIIMQITDNHFTPSISLSFDEAGGTKDSIMYGFHQIKGNIHKNDESTPFTVADSLARTVEYTTKWRGIGATPDSIIESGTLIVLEAFDAEYTGSSAVGDIGQIALQYTPPSP